MKSLIVKTGYLVLILFFTLLVNYTQEEKASAYTVERGHTSHHSDQDVETDPAKLGQVGVNEYTTLNRYNHTTGTSASHRDDALVERLPSGRFVPRRTSTREPAIITSREHGSCVRPKQETIIEPTGAEKTARILEGVGGLLGVYLNYKNQNKALNTYRDVSRANQALLYPAPPFVYINTFGNSSNYPGGIGSSGGVIGQNGGCFPGGAGGGFPGSGGRFPFPLPFPGQLPGSGGCNAGGGFPGGGFPGGYPGAGWPGSGFPGGGFPGGGFPGGYAGGGYPGAGYPGGNFDWQRQMMERQMAERQQQLLIQQRMQQVQMQRGIAEQDNYRRYQDVVSRRYNQTLDAYYRPPMSQGGGYGYGNGSVYNYDQYYQYGNSLNGGGYYGAPQQYAYAPVAGNQFGVSLDPYGFNATYSRR